MRRRFEAIPTADVPENLKQVPLERIGGGPKGFADSSLYRWAAYRLERKWFAAVTNNDRVDPELNDVLGLALGPGETQWYRVRGVPRCQKGE